MQRWKKVWRVTAYSAFVCLLSAQMATTSMANEAEASVMRLTGTEGTVEMESQNGKVIEIRENMKLYSGNTFETQKASYAYVSLDDTKAVKLDALSKAQIRKSGKKLELLLEAGNLFFNVTAPLTADENLNIRTSTMVTGIRGTAGYVEILNEKETKVGLLDGKVICRGYDPSDGRLKDFTIQAGQEAIFHARENQSEAEIVLGGLSEEDIPGFAAMEIKKSKDLQYKIAASANLDVHKIIGQAEEMLKQDELKAGAAADKIKQELDAQEKTEKTDPVYGKDSGGSAGEGSHSGSGSGSSGTSDSEDTEDSSQETVTRVMPVSAEELNTLLKTCSVILTAGSGSNNLFLDGSLTVPLGKKLTIGTGVSMNVMQGGIFSVDGSVETTEQFTNSGTFHNTSSNTFTARGGLINEPSGAIENTGRILVTGTMENRGTFDNQANLEVSGIIYHLEGQMKNSGSIKGSVESTALFDMSGGTAEHISQTQETLNLSGGNVKGGIVIGENAEFAMSGGMVYPGNSAYAVQSSGQCSLIGGTVYGGDKTAVCADRGILEVDNTAVSAKSEEKLFDWQDSVRFRYRGAEVSRTGRFNMLRDSGSAYQAGGYFTSLTEAFKGAAAGETVTARPGDELKNASPAKDYPFELETWDTENPVVLDLNGQDVELFNCIVLYRTGLTVTDSKKSGSLFMTGTNSQSADVPMFELQTGAKLNLKDIKMTQDAYARMIDSSILSEQNNLTLHITDCELKRNSSRDAILIYFAGSSRNSSHAVIKGSSISNKSADGYISAVTVRKAEAVLEDSEITTGDQIAFSLEEGTLIIKDGSLIENDSPKSSRHSALARWFNPEIVFDGGIIRNKNTGPAVQERVYGEKYGLPEDDMNTKIMGGGKDLFEVAQQILHSGMEPFVAYVPENYGIEQDSEGYYHIIPKPEAQEIQLLEVLPEELGLVKEPSSESDTSALESEAPDSSLEEPGNTSETDESQTEGEPDSRPVLPPAPEPDNPSDTDALEPESAPESEAGLPDGMTLPLLRNKGDKR